LSAETVGTDFAFLAFLIAVLRLSTPLIFASLGGFLSERSGVIQIGLEGLMLTGAFTGALVAHFAASSWMGWGAAFIAGLAVAAVYAFFVIELEADQIVAGTALNLTMAGLIPFISKIVFNTTGSTPAIDISLRFFWEPMVVMSVCLMAVQLWFSKTNSGLWVRFAGEKPKALESSGVSPRRVRWVCSVLAGGLAAWGGATLSLFLASSYSPMMTSGRGFMALAALIFGRWRPWTAALACLLFGTAEALQIRWQGQTVAGIEIPVQVIQILPYIFTIVALAGFVGRNSPPAALGRPLSQEK